MSNQRSDVDFNEPLERRDVDTERRDVDTERRDVFNPTLCNVATLLPTSQRQLVPLSVTSRRWPERRDVTMF